MSDFCTSRGVGQYVAGEAHTIATGRLWKPDSSKRPVIYFTGGPGDERDFLTTAASGNHIAPRLCDIGVLVASAAFGGAGQWGNDIAQTRIGQLWAYVKGLGGIKQDKFVGIGVSKGAAALLNYTRNNPANVAALLLIVPAVNLVDIHDNNRSGLAAEIDTAYGNGWATVKASHDPMLNAAAHASQATPMKLVYGDSDTTVLPATVTDFAAAVGPSAKVQSVGAYDHLQTATRLDPVQDVLKYVAPYL